MAVIYATLIIKGKKTLEEVPALIREEVKEILADLEVEV
ncbi:CD1375 family protein [Vagococcus xieshaowenii]|nr:CD1375 family protein [Vagococcus xieshaowenii]